MGALQRILFWFFGVIVVLVVISFFLPAKVHVERSASIAASPEIVFSYVNSLSEFNRWSPWSEIDPETEYEFSGPDAGVGSKMSWSSENNNVGSGTQEIVESVQNQHVATSLEFQGQGAGQARWVLTPAGEATEITWEFDTEMGMNPVQRYFGLMMDNLIGAQYEQGLANLKALVEEEHPAG